MAGLRSFVKFLKYKPKVDKLTKEEEKEASARADAFGESLQRFRNFIDMPGKDGWSSLTKWHAEQILNAATRGFRFVSIANLTAAIDRSKMVRAQYPGMTIIDKGSGLTGNDLAWVTSAASQALSRAISVSAKANKSKLVSLLGLTAASSAIIFSIGALISP